MTPLASLWLPIVVSAVILFVASSVIHMFSPWHKGDYAQLPDEDGVMRALRPFAIPPGEYMVPRPMGRAGMSAPDFIEKRNAGPVMIVTVIPSGPIQMGPTMVLWLLYLVAVAAMAACVAGARLHPGADPHSVFHYTAFISFIGFVVALWQMSIWFHRKWSTTFKLTIDGLIYAAITGGVFMWMWPKA